MRILSWGLCALLAIPFFSIFIGSSQFQAQNWAYLWETRLLELLENTLFLSLGTGTLTLLIGVPLAWLMVAYDFPGKRILEGALLLPMAIPAYVMAFVYLSQWDYAGVMPMWIRQQWPNFSLLPEFRSYGGAVFILSLALYPYVYLMSRSAFKEQSLVLFQAAQSLGVSRQGLFFKVALPIARSSILIGALLVMMESMADFGAVSMLSYDTFTTAIYQLWFGLFEKDSAIPLAGILLLLALGLFAGESWMRRNLKITQSLKGTRPLKATPLKGWHAALAFAFPGFILLISFIYPVGILIYWSIQGWSGWDAQLYQELLTTTTTLALITTLCMISIALILAYSRRKFPNIWNRMWIRMASMGYAMPGSVVAVGVLLPLSYTDHAFNQLLESWGFEPVGLILTGSIAGMVIGYCVRFMTVALNPIQSSLQRITPTLDHVAQSLGASPWKGFLKIHIPLIQGSTITAGLLVFVEVMKEMPATLLLRPFGVNTLSSRIWEMTAESYWEEAAIPALTIVAVELLPVILLIAWKGSSQQSASQK